MKMILKLSLLVVLLMAATVGLRSSRTSAPVANRTMISQQGGPPPTCPDGTYDCYPPSDMIRIGGTGTGH